MTTNILIGVGGTGAKVVEATLHAVAAGLGPETLRVGFVDQDQSNGNVSRTRRLLKTYADAHAQWRSMGRPHRIERSADGGAGDLFHSEVLPIAPDAELWVPHQGQGMTLSRILGDMTDERRLYDVLFAKGAPSSAPAPGKKHKHHGSKTKNATARIADTTASTCTIEADVTVTYAMAPA